jgi:leader peptidase (prepilin peptidase) / N-methyltransferase
MTEVTGTGGAPEAVVIAVAALVGLLVGSFLNVVAYRAPLGLSVSTPRSFCPTCDRTLHWWENVPIVSWVALRGRCHTCKQPISVRYPLVEATTAAVFALVTWAWHGSWPAAGYCILAATAIAVSLIEFGGVRSPLNVGAVGTGLGALLFVVAAGWLGGWAAVDWFLVGLLAGVIVLAVSRVRDPDCVDLWGRGRTMLPLFGCWLGGLGGWPALAGLAAWSVVAFACVLVLARERVRTARASGSTTGRPVVGIASVPLVTGVVVALAVSLVVAG